VPWVAMVAIVRVVEEGRRSRQRRTTERMSGGGLDGETAGRTGGGGVVEAYQAPDAVSRL